MLVQKFAREASQFLRCWFLESLGDDESEGCGESVFGGDSPRRLAEGDPVSSVSGGLPVAGDSLIPLLPDVVVRDGVWSALMVSPSVLLLYRLRCVSSPWKRFLITTVEWNVWVFMKLDSQDYCMYVVVRGLGYQPFSPRFEREVAAYKFLMAEDMEEIAFRVRFFRYSTWRLPYYVSLVECPPDVEISLEYYGL